MRMALVTGRAVGGPVGVGPGWGLVGALKHPWGTAGEMRWVQEQRGATIGPVMPRKGMPGEVPVAASKKRKDVG